MAQEGTVRRLTAHDWAAAALATVGEQGLSAVAVEPLAARLGTTKGSFYWHFRNRDALITATLDLWERSHTEAVIDAVTDAVAGHTDPAERLRALFASVSTVGGGGVEVNLLAVADHPLVAPVMRRVVRRRLAYLREIFSELGCADGEADRRALLAYAGYLGTTQLGQRLPDLLPSGRSAHMSYVDTVITLLIADV